MTKNVSSFVLVVVLLLNQSLFSIISVHAAEKTTNNIVANKQPDDTLPLTEVLDHDYLNDDVAAGGRSMTFLRFGRSIKDEDNIQNEFDDVAAGGRSMTFLRLGRSIKADDENTKNEIRKEGDEAKKYTKGSQQPVHHISKRSNFPSDEDDDLIDAIVKEDENIDPEYDEEEVQDSNQPDYDDIDMANKQIPSTPEDHLNKRNSFDLRPMKRNAFAFRPMKRNNFSFRPMKKNNFAFRPMKKNDHTLGNMNFSPRILDNFDYLMKRNNFAFRPMKRNNFAFRPMKRNNFAFRPMKKNNFAFRPMKRNNFAFRPMKRNNFAFRPMKRNSFALRPVKKAPVNIFKLRPMRKGPPPQKQYENFLRYGKRDSFALRPMKRGNTFAFRPMKRPDDSFVLRPMKKDTNPITDDVKSPEKKSSFSLRPMKKNTAGFQLRPMKRAEFEKYEIQNSWKDGEPLDPYQSIEDYTGIESVFKRGMNGFALRPMK